MTRFDAARLFLFGIVAGVVLAHLLGVPTC